MVATPSAALATTVWQAVLSDPVHIADIREQTLQSHPLLRYCWAKSQENAKQFQAVTGKLPQRKNGYTPKHMSFGPMSRLQFDMKVGTMATTGAIAPSSAISTSADPSLPTNPLRLLSGQYGLLYGVVSYGLEEEIIFGGSGGKNVNQWLPIVKSDLAQSLSAQLSTNIYSDGSSNQFDGLAYWRATTGTKWNSSNIATTDTFLQGQALSSTSATFTYQTWRDWIRQATYGNGIGTISQGRKPKICVCTSNLFDIFAQWVYDKTVINQPAAGNQFVELGLADVDYLCIDGVIIFADDVGLATDLSTNYAVAYLFDPDDLMFCFYNQGEFGFMGVDAEKEGGQAAEKMTAIEQPAYLFKKVLKKLILANMIHMRPRNLAFATMAT